MKILKGFVFVFIFAIFATLFSKLNFISSLGISPLVVGIILGIVYANTIGHKLSHEYDAGIIFSAKKVLRFAIVFYGFRISFEQIASVGFEGFFVSLIMVVTTFVLGSYAGIRWFKLDSQTSMLCASGASVCGAAAVLATEPVLKSQTHKSAIAVSMVVLFGTTALFLYPFMYQVGILDMNAKEFGVYIGGTIHEVAQVVAVGGAFGDEVANNAVIVKMTRVMLIAPMLIILGIYLSKISNSSNQKQQLVIPWFAVYFILVAGFNSLNLVPIVIVDTINTIDTFLLTIAMSALGIQTQFSKFKGFGLAPFYTALVMFVWLVVGGYFITKIIVS